MYFWAKGKKIYILASRQNNFLFFFCPAGSDFAVQGYLDFAPSHVGEKSLKYQPR